CGDVKNTPDGRRTAPEGNCANWRQIVCLRAACRDIPTERPSLLQWLLRLRKFASPSTSRTAWRVRWPAWSTALLAMFLALLAGSTHAQEAAPVGAPLTVSNGQGLVVGA